MRGWEGEEDVAEEGKWRQAPKVFTPMKKYQPTRNSSPLGAKTAEFELDQPFAQVPTSSRNTNGTFSKLKASKTVAEYMQRYSQVIKSATKVKAINWNERLLEAIKKDSLISIKQILAR